MPVRENAYVADAYWYGNTPRVIYELEGEAAEQLIPAIKATIQNYPYSASGSYLIWPGPNSNTFVSWIVRHTNYLRQSFLPSPWARIILVAISSLPARRAIRGIQLP